MAFQLRSFVMQVLPKPIARRVSAWVNARRCYTLYFRSRVRAILPTMLATGETANFTYDLNDRNLRYLAETIACALNKSASEITSYIDEAFSDQALRSHIERAFHARGEPSRHDVKCQFGRRLGWYAVARAIKPGIIVETGVQRGHGAVLLCSALMRNSNEGYPGRYFGTDIDPQAGWLLSGEYAAFGQILYGDSIDSLRAFHQQIDLFINDSDHSEDYELAEYETVAGKLSRNAVILGDNAHATDKLALFSRREGRRFLFFREEPKDHWYPGAGIGISFR